MAFLKLLAFARMENNNIQNPNDNDDNNNDNESGNGP